LRLLSWISITTSLLHHIHFCALEQTNHSIEMKITSTVLAALGLLVTANAIAIVPAGTSPRALGDGTVSTARGIPTIGTHESEFTTNGLSDDINPNTAITVFPGGHGGACFGCSYFINDCQDKCGNRGSCRDYCKCDAIKRIDCRTAGR
jgi:hypothetical protein